MHHGRDTIINYQTRGRPSKINYKTIIKLADSIQHNATITEACHYAGISRDTYYRHLDNPVFAEKMAIAKDNRSKLVFSFLTIQ
jgi:ACT domain-containing protein